MLILIKGAGDLATGIACRLLNAGYTLVMTEIAQPTVIRRCVSFAQAVYDGEITVEDHTACLAPDLVAVQDILAMGKTPIYIDPTADILTKLPFDGLVDAILAKENLGTNSNQARAVVAVGPGFTAGVDAHAVVETQRGHDLGRVLWRGSAVPNTGIPGNIGGYTIERVIHAPAAGTFRPCRQIGDVVKKGDVLGNIAHTPVLATIDGVLRGLLQDGLSVPQGMKIADIDPRCQVSHCFSISDKARAIGGGVLEALDKLLLRHA